MSGGHLQCWAAPETLLPTELASDFILLISVIPGSYDLLSDRETGDGRVKPPPGSH